MKGFDKLLILVLFIFSSCSSTYWERKQNLPYFGMTYYADNLYVDITEVTIGKWMEYYEWLFINKGVKEASEVLPDSNKVSLFAWRFLKNEITNIAVQNDTLSQKFITFYSGNCKDIVNQDSFYLKLFNKKKINHFCPYSNQPITGLTYTQVVNYCEWKTRMKGMGKIVYRLPTNDEWINIALAGLSENDKIKALQDSLCGKEMNCGAYNYRYSFKSQGIKILSLAQVALYSPNGLGVYDLFGNASEMTMTEGEAKGGNYSLFASKCHTDSIQQYCDPEEWLGFRCVAEEK